MDGNTLEAIGRSNFVLVAVSVDCRYHQLIQNVYFLGPLFYLASLSVFAASFKACLVISSSFCFLASFATFLSCASLINSILFCDVRCQPGNLFVGLFLLVLFIALGISIRSSALTSLLFSATNLNDLTLQPIRTFTPHPFELNRYKNVFPL